MSPYQRIIQKIDTTNEDVPDIHEFTINPHDWLKAHAPTEKMSWLLAFSDDRQLWGCVIKDGEKNKLTFSEDAFPRKDDDHQVPFQLNLETLQKLFLFNDDYEIRIWRVGQGFRANKIIDLPGQANEFFDESQILWGTAITGQNLGFTRVTDGRQGLNHSVPLKLSAKAFETNNPAELKRPLRLQIRYYLAKDGNNQVYIQANRLVKLWVFGG